MSVAAAQAEPTAASSIVPYAGTIFLSAFLLFLVQPIIAKQILPWFGGSAAVWTTCLVFFQSVLLAGYAYADLTHAPRRAAPGAAAHRAAAACRCCRCRSSRSTGWKPQGDEEPILRILLLLAATIGLPYFLLSTTRPLVQAWYWRRFQQRGAVPPVRAVELRLAARAARLPGAVRAGVRPARSSAGAGRSCTRASCCLCGDRMASACPQQWRRHRAGGDDGC